MEPLEPFAKSSKLTLTATALIMLLLLANTLIWLIFGGRQKADLPVFPAERDVVATLEQAHEQVGRGRDDVVKLHANGG